MSAYTTKPDTCIGCLWAEVSDGYAAGIGPTANVKLAVVAESLGENEARKGIPLIGWTGQEFDKLLANAGAKRSEVYLDNVIRCKPPAGTKKAIPRNVIEFCTAAHLQPSLERVKPNAILALGEYSLQYLTGWKGIGKYRSSILRSKVGGIKVIPEYHPAFLVKDHGNEGKASKARIMYPFMQYTFEKAVRESAYPEIRRQPERFISFPTIEQVRYARDRIVIQKRTVIDIETSAGNWWNTAPLTCGFSYLDDTNDKWYISVPFLKRYGEDYWQSEAELQEVIAIVDEILSDESIVKVIQNAAHEVLVMESVGWRLQ